MPGTGIAHGAVRLLCGRGMSYTDDLLYYALPTRCPALTYCMVLPALGNNGWVREAEALVGV
eukprot:2856513-Rhodomonas_salina.1